MGLHLEPTTEQTGRAGPVAPQALSEQSSQKVTVPSTLPSVKDTFSGSGCALAGRHVETQDQVSYRWRRRLSLTLGNDVG